jgi:hypothetical protein
VASTDPALERRLSEVRARAIHHPVGREGLVRTLVAVFFFSCAFAVAYTLASSIGFELGAGQALPTELVLVPMLFVLPAALVPMIIAAGLALAAACEVATGALSLRRAVVWPPVTSVFAFGPALVFVIGGEPQGDAHGAAVLAVAVVTQLAVDVIASSGLESVGNGVSPRELIRPLAWAFQSRPSSLPWATSPLSLRASSRWRCSCRSRSSACSRSLRASGASGSGSPTTEERAIVNTHTIEGERLLRRVGGLLADVGQIVRSCAESRRRCLSVVTELERTLRPENGSADGTTVARFPSVHSSVAEKSPSGASE